MEITKQTSTEFHFPVMEVIQKRRSTRAFQNKNIEAEKIKSLFEAVRWAPSSINEQPWFYIYATKDQHPELWQKLFDVLNDGNKIWAKDAPMLVLSLTRSVFSKNERPNGSALHDLGLANAFLTLEAVNLGLQSHQMGGYNRDVARTLFNIPGDFQLGPVIAVGYPGNPEKLPEELQSRERAPRPRFRQEEFTLTKGFGGQ